MWYEVWSLEEEGGEESTHFIALRAFYYDQIIYFMSLTIVKLKKT